MMKGSYLSQHINIFNQVISDLKRVDVKFADEDKVLTLLDTLRAFAMYESLVMTLMWGKRNTRVGGRYRCPIKFSFE